MQVVNPANEEVAEIRDTPIDQIGEHVRRAREAQSHWSQVSLQDRVDCLTNLKQIVLDRASELARNVTLDMGKPIKKSELELRFMLMQFAYFCEHATDWLQPEPTPSGYVQFDPLGVVGVISPWNVPLIAPILAITPALLAGNGVVFKPSEYTLRTGIEIGDCFEALPGLPAGLVQVVVGGKDHGRAVVESDVDMISFTGSGKVGKEIMRVSSERVRPIILELGGLDAAIVLKDADLNTTAKELVRNNCHNTGQICCSVKRVYVERDVYDEFVEIATEESQRVTFGNPMEDVDMGPLVAEFQLAKVEQTVQDARAKGANVLTGGERPQGSGYFYPSTIVTSVADNMQILNDEPFGPLLPIVPVDDWQEGVRLANATKYGLTGSVWTNDVELAKEVMGRMEVGVASLNSHGVGPAGTPFGGAKESGLGRIKNKDGIRAYTNIKTVAFK
ncbi:MAG: aldehyde dehydrogenase family protein [Planctomycetota bacterium]